MTRRAGWTKVVVAHAGAREVKPRVLDLSWKRLERVVKLYWQTEPGLIRVLFTMLIVALFIATISIISGSNNTAFRSGLWVQSLASTASLLVVLLTARMIR